MDSPQKKKQNKPSYYTLDELIKHGLEVHILDCSLQVCHCESLREINLKGYSVETILTKAQRIYDEFASTMAINSQREHGTRYQDGELMNSILFMRVLRADSRMRPERVQSLIGVGLTDNRKGVMK